MVAQQLSKTGFYRIALQPIRGVAPRMIPRNGVKPVACNARSMAVCKVHRLEVNVYAGLEHSALKIADS
jgi:hypothetical protein